MFHQEMRPGVRCGVLADDMGLGKTIQTLSLLALRNDGPTLIVAPKSALGHWEAGISKYFPDVFRVMRHYGPQKANDTREFTAVRPFWLSPLLSHSTQVDIVLTTYHTLLYDRKAGGNLLCEYQWFRFVSVFLLSLAHFVLAWCWMKVMRCGTFHNKPREQPLIRLLATVGSSQAHLSKIPWTTFLGSSSSST